MPSNATSDAAGVVGGERSSGDGSTDAASQPRIGVVVVGWNVKDLLQRCLATVAQSPVSLHVVVIDNASADGSAAMVRDEFPEVTLIANADNRGFTAANNQGFRALGLTGIDGCRVAAGRGESVPTSSSPAAAAPDPPLPAPDKAAPAPAPPTSSPPDYTLILNPDTEVIGDALAVLADYLDRHPEVGAVGPLLQNPDGSVQPSRRRFPSLATGLVESTPVAWHWPDNAVARRYHMADVPADAAGPVDWVTGAAILLRSSALAAAGGFDEGFFMYSEELDLCRRLADAGWAVHFCPAARIMHHEGRSSAQVAAARHLSFQRSRVRYFHKHHGAAAAGIVRVGILAAYAGELGIEALKWLLGHQRALRRARIAAYWNLLRDGLRPESVRRTALPGPAAGT